MSLCEMCFGVAVVAVVVAAVGVIVVGDTVEGNRTLY